MLNSIQPNTGSLLISEPFMLDPNFKRSVILITEYATAGVIGFVLNHQSDVMLGDVMPDIAYSEMPLFRGGPVGIDTMHFIHRCPEKIEGGIPLGEGVFWGGDFDMVKELVNTYQLNNNKIKFFIGYSGWGEGQLEDELKENTWIVTDKFDPNILFNHHEETLWKDVVISLGQRYAHIVNFPENPTLN